MHKAIPIAAIRVGKRHRKDLGNIRPLARSIQEIGLLHPVVIRPDGVLIAGERRLGAVKLLGWNKRA
jgi:ParB family transcriptional regulator, chromosome partitioning protein